MAVITGNVTRDPELRYTPSGTAVCSFGVATNHSIKKDDQWTDVPTFHNIVVWGKQAEYISGVVKGMRISLTGRIDNRQYDAKDGTKDTSVKLLPILLSLLPTEHLPEGSSEGLQQKTILHRLNLKLSLLRTSRRTSSSPTMPF